MVKSIPFPETVTILDNMMEKKICDPCIIVTPTFYHNEEDQHVHDESRCENFKNEIRKDLVPAVESKYSCYTEGDVTKENLIKTRRHRGFAGLSPSYAFS